MIKQMVVGFVEFDATLDAKCGFCEHLPACSLRGDVHTQTATPNVKSTFVGGWVVITDVLTWQFGDFQFLQGIENSCYEDCQVQNTHSTTIIHHCPPTWSPIVHRLVLAFTSL